MKITVVDHPLVQHKLGLMRRADLSTKEFRDLASEVATLLTYEATSDLPTEEVEVDGWAGPVRVRRIKGRKVTLVPILRAGLGMLPGVLELVPAAKVGVVGLQRDEATLDAVGYYEKLVGGMSDRIALILDPMLATGGTCSRPRARRASRRSASSPRRRGCARWRRGIRTSRSSSRRSTSASTSTATSCRAWATPGTASSVRACAERLRAAA